MGAARKPARMEVVMSQTNGPDGTNVFSGYCGDRGQGECVFQCLGDQFVPGSGQCSDGTRSMGQELPMSGEGADELGMLSLGRS